MCRLYMNFKILGEVLGSHTGGHNVMNFKFLGGGQSSLDHVQAKSEL